MTTEKLLFDQVKELIVSGKKKKARELVDEVIDTIDPLDIIEKSLSPAMAVIGDKFGTGEIYLPEMMNSAKAFEKVMEVLRPKMQETGREVEKIGTIVIGTVSKDVHEIGKNIVTSLLSTSGFEVHDIGYDKPAMEFVMKAQEANADIIAASALMTTTMPYQRDIVETLESMGLRDKYKVMVGGGAVTQAWADEMNADGYAVDAPQAVKLARKLMQ
jgi:corrinoid protein of di/trimethylamine methyltransferase